MTSGSPREPGLRWQEVLWLALFLGLCAGAIEVSVALFYQQILGRIVWLSRDMVWMTPLSSALFALIPGAALAVLSRARRIPPHWIVGLLGFYAASVLLFAVEGIAWYASAVLAAGIAVQSGRLARRPADGLVPLARRGALMILGLSATLGVAQRGWRAAGERLAIARLPEAAADAPNVLLLIYDTVRQRNLSLYGYPRPTTPHLDRRASEGTVFELALSTAPWTLPSHASMFTGHYPDSSTGNWRQAASQSHRYLAESLRDRGYLTGAFVDNLLYTSYESGLQKGFVHYDDYPVTLPLILRHSAMGRSALLNRLLQSKSAYDVKRAVADFNLRPAREGADEPPRGSRRVQQFLGWERTRGDRPFFAFINLFTAHGLFTPTPDEEARFPGGTALDYYDAAISRMDRRFNEMLDSLAARGVLDNTIVIVTSDHGEHFGEHGLRGHANSLYLDVLHVPLYIRFPRKVPGGLRVPEPVTLRDLPATILDLADAPDSVIPGSSLARHWGGNSTSGSPLYAALSQGINLLPPARNAETSLESLADGRYRLIRSGAGNEELFDYMADPQELHNLVGDSALRNRLAGLRSGLATIEGYVVVPNGTTTARR